MSPNNANIDPSPYVTVINTSLGFPIGLFYDTPPIGKVCNNFHTFGTL